MAFLRMPRAIQSELYRCPDLLGEGVFGNKPSSHSILHCPAEQPHRPPSPAIAKAAYVESTGALKIEVDANGGVNDLTFNSG
jgi:hypothetical protein